MNRERRLQNKTADTQDLNLNREDFLGWHQDALILLKVFHVENLTNLEARQIRQDIQTAMKNNAELEAKEIMHHDVSVSVNPSIDAVEKFLLQYGVNLNELSVDPKTNSYMADPVLMESLRNKIRKAREEAHKPYLD
jgi:hypothetical protein